MHIESNVIAKIGSLIQGLGMTSRLISSGQTDLSFSPSQGQKGCVAPAQTNSMLYKHSNPQDPVPERHESQLTANKQGLLLVWPLPLDQSAIGVP